MRVGNMMQIPLRTAKFENNYYNRQQASVAELPLQLVEQLMLTKSIPRHTITCISDPSAPRYLVSAISAE